jgi:hypothetical protein
MESIKTSLSAALESAYGEFTVVMDDSDKGFSICIHQYNQHVIYIRPDDRETHYLCHYAHRDDLERTEDDNKERQEWKQQAVFQLARTYKGGLSKYVEVAMQYVASATERMELYREVSGRGAYHRVRTFAEVVLDHQRNPKPKRPDPTIPPPVCKRHNAEYKKVVKRKRIQEALALGRSVREKREESYVWRP